MRFGLKKTLFWLAATIVAIPLGMAVLAAPTIYRLVHGVNRYETQPPLLPAALPRPAILVFSKTNGFRDDASIRAANAMLAQLARQHGWSAYFTENAAVFNAKQLPLFSATVWNSVSGDVLTNEQRAAFRGWLEQGGGFVGIHGSGGDPQYRWRWYVDTLIGAQFIGHTMWPQFQLATIHIEDPVHPAMRGLGDSWTRTDEWYSFDQSVRRKGYHVLATLDERTYSPKGFLFHDNISMGADHPIIWAHCVGHGRVFYSALGHKAETYAEPQHRRMLGNAIEWAAGRAGDGC